MRECDVSVGGRSNVALVRGVTAPDGLVITYRGICGGGNTTNVSNVAIFRVSRRVTGCRGTVVTGLLSKACRPRPIGQMSVPGRGNDVHGLKVPIIESEIMRRTVLRVVRPLVSPRFSGCDFNFQGKEDTRSTVGRTRGCVRSKCGAVISYSLGGCFSVIGRRGLVICLERFVRSRVILGLV